MTQSFGDPEDPESRRRAQVVFLARLMQEAILGFEEGRASLSGLSTRLHGLISALDAVADHEWVEELRSMRNQLEFVNAVFIDSGRGELTDQERQAIEDTLGELRGSLIVY